MEKQQVNKASIGKAFIAEYPKFSYSGTIINNIEVNNMKRPVSKGKKIRRARSKRNKIKQSAKNRG